MSVTNVTNVVMICDNVCHRYDIFPCNSGLERLGETGSWSQSLPSCQVTIIVSIIFSSSLSLSFFLPCHYHHCHFFILYVPYSSLTMTPMITVMMTKLLHNSVIHILRANTTIVATNYPQYHVMSPIVYNNSCVDMHVIVTM